MSSNYYRYKSDSWIENITTEILYHSGEMRSNQLRKVIRLYVVNYKDGIRKKRRDDDKNTVYTPSQAKISASMEQLLKMKWIERREIKVHNKQGFKGLPKVNYSLSHEARSAYEIGFFPEENYMLKDLYQMILRTASMGIYSIEEDNFMGHEQLAKTSIVIGTTVDDIYLKKDCILFANFNHRVYTRHNIESLFARAFEEGVIRKELINNEERYVIEPGLKEFISKCWKDLFYQTLNIVKNTIILKKKPRKDSNYKVLYDWMVSFSGKKHVESEFIKKWTSQRNGYRKHKRELSVYVQNELDQFPSRKQNLRKIHVQTNNIENSKFEKLKEAVIHAACPINVLEAVRNILKN